MEEIVDKHVTKIVEVPKKVVKEVMVPIEKEVKVDKEEIILRPKRT